LSDKLAQSPIEGRKVGIIDRINRKIQEILRFMAKKRLAQKPIFPKTTSIHSRPKASLIWKMTKFCRLLLVRARTK
jgi:hypothetical protein